MLPSRASSVLTYQVLGVNPIFQISVHILHQKNLPQYPKTDCLPPFILSHLGVSIPSQHSSWSVTNTCVYWFTARLSPADWDLHEDRTSPTLVAHYIFAEWMNESWISQQKTELASTYQQTHTTSSLLWIVKALLPGQFYLAIHHMLSSDVFSLSCWAVSSLS